MPPLTVAVTGPTGEVGKSLIDALGGLAAGRAVRGMARRAFDPSGAGWSKATYQRGDILDRGHLAELFDGADVAVHLAFAIFGDREETRRINLEGSRNVFEAAVEAGVERLVYASSVAAYGFHPDNPQPLTEETPALGSPRFYYSAQKAELEEALDEILAGSELDAYVFRPCIVAGPRATMLIEQTVGAARLGDPAPRLRRHVLEPDPAAAPDPPRRRRPAAARPSRRRRLGPRRRGRGQGRARRLQPGRRRRDPDRRHRPRPRLALGPRPAPRPRRRHRGRRPPLLRQPASSSGRPP